MPARSDAAEGLRELVPTAAAPLAELPRLEEDAEDEELERYERAATDLVRSDPAAAGALDAIEEIWTEAVYALSVDPALRKSLAYLRDPLLALSAVSEPASWLATLLRVLDQEPLLVVEPDHRRGFRGAVSGVVDNFQLHMLLMTVLPPPGGSERPVLAPELAAVARGDGPQELDATVEGAWNLYDWTAVEAGGLPAAEPPTSSWIWGEGAPDEIPSFEGARVVVLGPASYVRTWPASRMFPDLKAEIRVDDWLAPHEVAELTARMAGAHGARDRRAPGRHRNVVSAMDEGRPGAATCV